MTLTVSVILRLIMEEAKRSFPQLVPADAVLPDYVRCATASDNLKHHLLDGVYERSGPQAILKVGSGLEGAGFAPILHILLQASTPGEVFRVWRGLEENSTTRFRIEHSQSVQDRSISVYHYTKSGPRARNTESLLICGVLLFVLEKIGLRGLRCFLISEGRAETLVYNNKRFVIGGRKLEGPVCNWRFEWDAGSLEEASTQERSRQNSNLPLLAEYKDPEGVVRAVILVLEKDVMRSWKIDELASVLRFSRRTLQRQLHLSEVSFSLILRAVRLREASLQLFNTHVSITDIAHSCGFSDGAHFSRDFRKSVGTSPIAYRRIAMIG